ncbi:MULTISPECIES: RNA polymerase sigma-70 factor [unclassified Carboxylicivirga]|uniref:RNA polymerase sigma-70 factor n=1 Tax=Carboxylicivirga TaxID=1628153 RepID=UPI003D34D659
MIRGKETAKKIQAGNLKAFQKFYMAHFKRLLNYANLFVARRDEAEDIVQEAFFKLWSNRSEIDCDQSLKGLLFRSVRNACLNVLKKDEVHARFVDFAKHCEDIEHVYKVDFDLPAAGDQDLYVIDEIKKAIDEMPGKRKEVFRLAKIEGQSHAEIAEHLDITTKGVERHITLANKMLRIRLRHVVGFVLLLFVF